MKVHKIKAAGNNKLYIIVDDEDYEYLSQWKWSITARGYALRGYRVDGKLHNIYLHRQLIDATKGDIVDHINGNPLDNRRCNLRICTSTLNNMNRPVRSDSKTRIKGVKFIKGRAKGWGSYIRVTIDGKKRDIYKYHFNIQEAIDSYNSLAKKYYGEFAKLNRT